MSDILRALTHRAFPAKWISLGEFNFLRTKESVMNIILSNPAGMLPDHLLYPTV
jgi:hypothetical protein